jgi:hypothetical protein
MRVVAEPLEELLDVLVQHRVLRDVGGPLVELRRGRQLTKQQEVGRLEKVAVFRQLLDRIPAVHQDAAIAVDERDAAAAGGGVRERRVVGHHAELVGIDLDLAQIHRADRVVLDRNLVFRSGAVVGDRQRVGHVYSVSSSSVGAGAAGMR